MNYKSNSGGYRILPPAIKTIMIINAIVFIFSYLLADYRFGGFSIAEFLYKNFALYPFGEVNPFGTFYPWQLVTYQFMHANFSHLFFNLFSLWMFGSEVENYWGAKKFTWFYLLSGIGAGLVQLIVMQFSGSVGATVGASGAVYGVLVAFAVLNPDRRVMIIPIPIPIKSKVMVGLMIAFDLFLGLTSDGNVAHFAHLGGAITGFLLAKYGDKIKIYRQLSANSYYRESSNSRLRYEDNEPKIYSTENKSTFWRKEPENNKEEENTTSKVNKLVIDGENITQNKIDAILDKISSSGYTNLTEHEKKILVELSKNIR